MSGLDAAERQQLYAALRDGMDGWSLVGAALGRDEVGADVEIGEARPEEVVAWAVGRVEHVVAAIADVRAQAERERVAAAIESAYAARASGGQQSLRIPEHSPAWLVERAYQDAARIARGDR